MFTNEDRDRLEALIDHEGIADLIDEISSICFDKGEKLKQQKWLSLGEKIERFAEVIDNLGVFKV